MSSSMACHSLNIDVEEIQSPQSHVSSDFNSTSPRSPTPPENEWVPNCVEELKPKVGQQFDTLEEGKNFYKRYAHNVGFSVRCSSETKDKNGVKRWKYFVCSKEGYKPDKEKVGEQSNSTIKSRRRSLIREGCNAKAVFKLVEEGKYELIRFHESHTHVLASPMKRPFQDQQERTTSRSESENSFYGNFLNPHVSLVEFWMRFDSAIEAQRQKELLADNDSLHSTPKLKLDRDLEKHGSNVYTHENFYIFQNEL
ncbi:FAR1 DNA-binding domain [Sesbania bispinosa]|nr:FAR1 DNA-binding domain [Sesbania bispinosa]